jgi:hypothetical protein
MSTNENGQETVTMVHPDLGDPIEVPVFAVPLRQEMGYVRPRTAAAKKTPARKSPARKAAAKKTAASSTPTTSETATSPGSDDGQPAANPAD